MRVRLLHLRHPVETASEYLCSHDLTRALLSASEYLWDHRNGSMLREFIVNEIIGGPIGVDHTAVSGVNIDDFWESNGNPQVGQPTGPSEEDSHAVADMGLTPTDVAEMHSEWLETMVAVRDKLIAVKAWQAEWSNCPFTPNSTHYCWGVDATQRVVNGVAAQKADCTAHMREHCKPNNRFHSMAYSFVFTREAGHVGSACLKQDLARFLLLRGPYAWIGYMYSWQMCGDEYVRPPELDYDLGEPTGDCQEVGDSEVFTRTWSKSNISLDCRSFAANVTLLKSDDDDVWVAKMLPRGYGQQNQIWVCTAAGQLRNAATGRCVDRTKRSGCRATCARSLLAACSSSKPAPEAQRWSPAAAPSQLATGADGACLLIQENVNIDPFPMHDPTGLITKAGGYQAYWTPVKISRKSDDTTGLPVQRHVGRWNSTPTMTPGTGNVIDGPLIGNGDAGAALTSSGVETLDFYLGKGDYWADAVDYHWGFVYMHLSGGKLSLSLDAASEAKCLAAGSGKPTTASASWDMEGPSSESGCSSDADCTPIGMLLTDTFFGTAAGSFTVTSVPFAAYEVIVYFRMNEDHSFNISSQECATGQTPTTVRPLSAANGSFVSAQYPRPSNFVRLSGCTGDNVTVDLTAGGLQANHRKSMAALQIVESGVSSPSRSLGLNIVGKTANDKTGPILLQPNIETGVVPQKNWVNLGLPGCGEKKMLFNASQHLYEARIDGASGRLRSSSIMQANENTLITRLECMGCADKQRVELSLEQSDFWKMPAAAGVSATQLWNRHENNYADQNPMAIGSCDPNAVFVRGVSRFIQRDAMLVVSNGTDDECPMLLPPGAPTGTWAKAKERLVVRGPVRLSPKNDDFVLKHDYSMLNMMISC